MGPFLFALAEGVFLLSQEYKKGRTVIRRKGRGAQISPETAADRFCPHIGHRLHRAGGRKENQCST